MRSRFLGLLLVCLLGASGARADEFASFTVDVKLRGSGVEQLHVQLRCGPGDALVLEFEIPVDASQTFTVPAPGGQSTDCSLTADPVVGQRLSFLGEGGSTFDPDSPGCRFTGVRGGHANFCQIQVESQETSLTVFKHWIGTSDPVDDVSVSLDCGPELRLEDLPLNKGKPGKWLLDVTDAEGILCRVHEEKGDSYLSDTSDCDDLLIRPGAREECTVVNTKVVKMIEMLNRYGLVIMILAFMVVGGFAARRAMP
jgi:hypothetical protein